jgi:carboxymethylenebutenolidase
MVDLFGALPEPFASRTTALPPTLVLHGEADTIVPVAEAHRLVAKLKAIGTPFDVRIYPNEGHVLSPVAGFDAARRIVAFLNEHIAP